MAGQRAQAPSLVGSVTVPLAGDRDAASLPRIAIGLALWACGWLLLTWLTTQSPPVDNAEQLSWVRSLQWGYYKHPPLPTVLLWPLVRLFGIHEWVSYAAGALVTGCALVIAHRLQCVLLGGRRALLATLATLCVGYYSHRLAYYNHDVVLLLVQAAAASLAWHAMARRSMAAWWALGAVLGLGALTKYQVVLVGGSVLAWWLAQGAWRDALHRRGLAVAAGLAAVVAAPHLVWVITHDFLPLHYAMESTQPGRMGLGACTVGVLRWLSDQASQFAGAALFGGLLWAGNRRRAGAGLPAVPAELAVRRFLLCWGVLPLLLIPLIALATGGQLRRSWGTAFMLFSCAALMVHAAPALWQRVHRGLALRSFVVVQLIAAAVAIAGMPRGQAPVLTQDRSHQFASQWVADTVGAPARLALGSAIRVIAGPQRLVSTIALRLPERPLVLVDGRYELSPWLPQDMRTMCGVLWMGGAGDRAPPDTDRHDIGGGLWWAVERLSDDPDHCRPAP